jgi:hypothetical protein
MRFCTAKSSSTQAPNMHHRKSEKLTVGKVGYGQKRRFTLRCAVCPLIQLISLGSLKTIQLILSANSVDMPKRRPHV